MEHGQSPRTPHAAAPHYARGTTHGAVSKERASERRACLCSQRSEGRKEGNEPLPILLFSLHTLGRLCSPTLRLLSLSLALRLGALLSASGPHSARPPAPAPVRSTCLFHLTERRGRRKEGRKEGRKERWLQVKTRTPHFGCGERVLIFVI